MDIRLWKSCFAAMLNKPRWVTLTPSPVGKPSLRSCRCLFSYTYTVWRHNVGRIIKWLYIIKIKTQRQNPFNCHSTMRIIIMRYLRNFFSVLKQKINLRDVLHIRRGKPGTDQISILPLRRKKLIFRIT